MPVRIRRYDEPNSAAAMLDDILPAYEEIFSEPPYRESTRDVADFIDRYRNQARRCGFRIAVASDGNETLGFAFGFPLPADTGWWKGSLLPLAPEVTTETGQRTFALIELAVRQRWRRQGIARQLHDTLLANLTVERVTLTVRPEREATPAQAAYVSWGYQRVAQSRPWDEAPIYDLMLRPSVRTAPNVARGPGTAR